MMNVTYSPEPVFPIAYGCMNIGGQWNREPLTAQVRKDALAAIEAAVKGGITLFDHADIYMQGKSEEVFAQAWAAIPGLRDRIILQSKCGIRLAGDPVPETPGRYDFSYDHIIRSVEGSLRRLQTEYLDVLLLHRPDPLIAPGEVARAFDHLYQSGKVRHFGVSNHTPAQMDLLQAVLDQPLVANQVQLSLLHHFLISEGIRFNTVQPLTTLSTGTLDYCRLHNIQVQAWSPVAGGRLFNPPAGTPAHIRETATLVHQLAVEKETNPTTILLAWLLRHPAGIMPIIGTTKPRRIRESCAAVNVTLSREEWYKLLTAAMGAPVP
jgi:predicted oxidoreductase